MVLFALALSSVSSAQERAAGAEHRQFLPLIMSGSAQEQAAADYRHVRSIETEDVGFARPAGLAYSAASDTFLVVQRSEAGQPAGATEVVLLTQLGERAGSVRIAATVRDPVNMAYDGRAERLLVLTSVGTLLEVKTGPSGALNPAGLRRYPEARATRCGRPLASRMNPTNAAMCQKKMSARPVAVKMLTIMRPMNGIRLSTSPACIARVRASLA